MKFVCFFTLLIMGWTDLPAICQPAAISPSPADSSAHASGTPFDLQGYIDGELARGKKEVVVPPGRYRVAPHHARHLFFDGLVGVTINALGVEMICTETTTAIRIERCRDLTIRGLAIDYDPLPYTQGHITALSPDKSVQEVELFADYPDTTGASSFKYEIFDAYTRTLRTHDYGIKSFEKLDATHLKITKDSGSKDDPERVGDIVVMGNADAPGGSTPHAVYLNDSVNTRLEDIGLFASNCFGFFETSCTANVYLRCHVDRCPPERDMRPRDSARIRSLNADAFHSKFAPKGPALLQCSARFMGDDAVNICGNYQVVTSGSGDTYTVLANPPFLREGDTVQLFTYEGVSLPDTKAVKIVPLEGNMTEQERQFLLGQRMHEAIRRQWNPKRYQVTFEHPVALTWFSVVASQSALGNGFQVKDCHFGFNRSRGILIKASEGEISGNTVEESWMDGISVAPEYWWLEAGSSSHLNIHDNTVRGVRGTAIGVDAVAGNGQQAASGAHRDLVISNNTVTDSPLPQIRVNSTSGLHVENNRLSPYVPADASGDHTSIVTNHCDAAIIRYNAAH